MQQSCSCRFTFTQRYDTITGSRPKHPKRCSTYARPVGVRFSICYFSYPLFSRDVACSLCCTYCMLSSGGRRFYSLHESGAANTTKTPPWPDSAVSVSWNENVKCKDSEKLLENAPSKSVHLLIVFAPTLHSAVFT